MTSDHRPSTTAPGVSLCVCLAVTLIQLLTPAAHASDPSAPPPPWNATAGRLTPEPVAASRGTGTQDGIALAATEHAPRAAAPTEERPGARDPRKTALSPALAPASARLQYGVEGSFKGMAYRARSSLDWSHLGNRYAARMEVHLFLLGSRVQNSVGRLGAAGLQPERFSDRRRTEHVVLFDHEQARISFGTGRPDAPLEPGAQDRLSVFLQLSALLNARPDGFRAGDLVTLPVAGTGEAEIWRFRIGTEETLALPAGTLRARHLFREPRRAADTQVDIWLAPRLEHLPVRIRLTQPNGDQVDQQLSQWP